MAEIKEECAVAGIIGDPEAANFVYLALYALQHRGQEASGIVTLDDLGNFFAHKDFGLVKDVFSREHLAKLKGSIAVGHNRYPTYGGRSMQNIQPFAFRTALGPIAIAQNGQLTNAGNLRKDLEERGSIFHSTSDTEVFTHLIARSSAPTIKERIFDVMNLVKGAYSLVIVTKDELFAVRDPYGFRPLVLGRYRGAKIVASETCALDLIGGEYERDVKPGEVLHINGNLEVTSYQPVARKPQRHCAFEPIYFSRPDSRQDGTFNYEHRKKMGEVLAQEAPVAADVVIAIPDSGMALALGYAQATGIPFEIGLVRNHYVGRTFIEPSQSIRDFGVKLKLNPIPSVLKDKRVVVVDDSLVRGTTAIKIIRMLRQAGVREVHLRLGCPPITHSCFYGVDTPDRKNLMAAQFNVDEMREALRVDSLAFLSLPGLEKALGEDAGNRYCFACFSGCYEEETGSAIPSAPTDKNGPGLKSPRDS